MDSAQHEFAEERCRLLGLLQDSIDTGLNAVADGTTSLDVQVCFVAGTPIRLSSGEVIPVEEAKPGMKVRVPNENDPEGEHFESEIVEVYHNPPSPVTRLQIESETTGRRTTIRGTDNHRFYVVGFGWKAIRDLEIGDRFLSENGEKMLLLVAKELEPEPVPVYNFQVKGCHTYFVGETEEDSVLVHNERCSMNTSGAEWCNIDDGWCMTHWVAVGGGAGYISNPLYRGGGRFLIRNDSSKGIFRKGITATNPQANTTPGQHALGVKPSPYNSWSTNIPDGAKFNGTPYAINVQEYLNSGGKIVPTQEIVDDIKRMVAVGEIEEKHAKKLIKAVISEGETLTGNVPAEQIKPGSPPGWKGKLVRGTGKACFVVGAAQTGYNMSEAAVESFDTGSIAPLAAQGIREGGIWGGAWAGATALAPVGTLTGPAAPIAVPVLGAIGGVAGAIAGCNGDSLW